MGLKYSVILHKWSNTLNAQCNAGSSKNQRKHTHAHSCTHALMYTTNSKHNKKKTENLIDFVAPVLCLTIWQRACQRLCTLLFGTACKRPTVSGVCGFHTPAPRIYSCLCDAMRCISDRVLPLRLEFKYKWNGAERERQRQIKQLFRNKQSIKPSKHFFKRWNNTNFVADRQTQWAHTKSRHKRTLFLAYECFT